MVMSIWDHIESKSSAVRAQYAFGIASMITILISLVWASTLPARFAQNGSSEVIIEEEKKGFSELFHDTKSQLGNIVQSTKKSDESQVETASLDALNTDTSLDNNATLDGSLGLMESIATTQETGTGSPSAVNNISENNILSESSIKPSNILMMSSSTQSNVPVPPRIILIGTTTNLQTDL